MSKSYVFGLCFISNGKCILLGNWDHFSIIHLNFFEMDKNYNQPTLMHAGHKSISYMPVNNKWWVAQKMHTLKAYNYHWHCSRQNYPSFLPKTFWRLWLASWTLRILMQTHNWLDNFAITLHANSTKKA